MKYDFDKIIDRSNTNALKKDGWREYIFKDPEGKKTFKFDEEDLIHMWVADMEFRTADEIIDAIKARADHGSTSARCCRKGLMSMISSQMKQAYWSKAETHCSSTMRKALSD